MAEDLADTEGTVDYQVVAGEAIPEEAVALHQKARQLGSSGDFEAALEALSEAQALAPDWPYPVYDMAFTYLLMKDVTKARECYRKTVEMAPRGFFTAITALDALDREASGDLPEGTYAAYMALEWIPDPEQKARIVSQMVERFPTFAPAWKELALQCDDPAEKLAAIEKGLDALPDRETKGILLINKALTLDKQGETEEAKLLLGGLVSNPETTLANEQLAKQTLALIRERPTQEP
jgi:tetratricopeptide (TPR) repeat protein